MIMGGLYAIHVLGTLSCLTLNHSAKYVDALETSLHIPFITRPSLGRKPPNARRRMRSLARILERGMNFVRQALEAEAGFRVHTLSPVETAELTRGLGKTNRVIPFGNVSAVCLTERGVLQNVLGLRGRCNSCT
jgi:hypothetical protein